MIFILVFHSYSAIDTQVIKFVQNNIPKILSYAGIKENIEIFSLNFGYSDIDINISILQVNIQVRLGQNEQKGFELLSINGLQNIPIKNQWKNINGASSKIKSVVSSFVSMMFKTNPQIIQILFHQTKSLENGTIHRMALIITLSGLKGIHFIEFKILKNGKNLFIGHELIQ